MSNYHVLDAREYDDTINVVFHIPLPDIGNTAGFSYRMALLQWRPPNGSKVPWQQSGTEYDQIQIGAIYEHQEKVSYDANLTNVQKAGITAARYTELVGIVQKRLQAILKYWGKDA